MSRVVLIGWGLCEFGGKFVIHIITNFILCNYYLWPSRLCIGKGHLRIKYQKRGLCLEKDCVMNMTVLRHEYKGGCILTFLWGIEWG